MHRSSLSRWSRLIFSLLLLTLALASWGVGARAQVGGGLESLPAWGVAPSPNGGIGPNELEGVAVLSPTDVWAVGDFGSLTAPDPATHHWDGVTWGVVPLPGATPKGELLDIDALSPTDVWAVGGAQNTGDSFIFHWDGSAWSAVPHPSSHTYQRLYGVSALAPDDIWAVGTSSDNGGVSVAFSLHWNGTSWSEIPTPSPNGGYSKLQGVVALAPNDVWAVGDDGQDPRALHWDGTAWQVAPIPSKGQWTEYFAISAVASNDIWAVGEGADGQITAHWDGSQWTEIPNPAPSGLGELQDVAAIASDDVWAVGWFGAAQWQTFAMHWDGSGWTVVPTPSPDTSINKLVAVDGDASNNVWAVGEGEGTLVARWDGTQWLQVPSSNVSNAANALQDVAALNPGDAWAVGSASGDAVTMHWNGSSWQLVAAPTDPKGVFLDGVAMAATDDVWAVGYTGAGGGLDTDPVTLHWDGSAWSRVPAPEPGGNEVDELHDVLALASDDVWAVGEYGGTGDHALILHWTGSAWQPVPNGCQYGLYAIDARSATDLWAAGADTVCRYDGTSWTRMNPPGFPLLLGVDVLAPDDVWVVGQETFCGPKSCTTNGYAAHWNGSSWQEVDIPAVSMADVLARAPNDVYAVGTFSLGTAIAHWDGSAWQDVPAPDPGDGGFLFGLSDNGAGRLWAVGSFYPTEDFAPQRTLVLDAPSLTHGASFGNVGYGQATILWLGPTTGSTLSDSFGDYAVGGLPAGTYTFVAIGDGCPPQQATVQVHAGEHVRQDFDLCGDPPTPVPTRTATATPSGPSPTATGEPPSPTPTAADQTPLPTATATEAPPLPTATPTGEPPTPTATSEPPAPTATPTGEPPIMLEPPSVGVTQPAGGSSQQRVELHNLSGGSLVWSSYEAPASCNLPGEVGWLHATPAAGVVSPGGMVELMIHVDTMNLPTGTHSGFLCLLDSSGRVQPLPVSVAVMGENAIRLFLPLAR